MSVDTSGGVGGTGAPGAEPETAGGDGRFLLCSNTVVTPPATIVNAQQLEFDGTRGVNPFIKGATTLTPYLPDLVGGAELFGLLEGIDAQAADFQAVRDQAPGNAVAALYRGDVGPTGYADDFEDFDMLVFLNLSGEDLAGPALGIDPAALDGTFANALLTGGYLTDPQFGGAGPQVLSELGADEAWATLIPEGDAMFNAAVSGDLILGLRGIGLANGEFAYISLVPAGCNPGDANADGVVNLLDLDLLGQSYGMTEGAECINGDFNGDGKVDLLDLDILGRNYGETYDGAVPEPATLGLLTLGGLAVMGRRRR